MFATYHTHKASTFKEKQQQINGKHRFTHLKNWLWLKRTHDVLIAIAV